jgi:hypothetical protein
MGSGLLAQIQKSQQREYKALTEESLLDFLNGFKDYRITPEYVVTCGEFGSRYMTATFNNDVVELEKLREESIVHMTIIYQRTAKLVDLDYDMVYMLSKKYHRYDDNGWTISDISLSENEYDDSSEYSRLVYDKGTWSLDTYITDGWYDTKLISTKKIDKNDIFSMFIL